MIYFLLFLFGVCFGSFLNVLIDRIPAGKSVLFGRSQCDFCKKQLGIFDLIPVISYVFLLGKCRYCKKKLSLQYPMIEVLTGFLFVFLFFLEMPITFIQFQLFLIDIFLVSMGFALTIMDIKYHLLSDKLLVVFGFFALLRISILSPQALPFSFLVGLLATLPLFLIFFFSKGKGMGFGDVKLIGILGFLLGFPNIILCYYIAFLTGAVAGVILILGGKKKLHNSVIAFGPFLFLGAFITYFFENTLWQYAKIFLGF
ncbi:MAG TPA: prepilin peptidase [Patescibacteria group bacterium]|nr:prepilin peptidase [Patescibacteria group bacterium]